MTDLATLEGIVIGGARGGKKVREDLHLEFVRDLQQSDLPLLLNPPPKGSIPGTIKTLRHSHHRAAKLLAEGKKPGEISLLTGYAASSVSNMQRDPAFQELMAYYKENVDGVYLDAHARLASLGLDMADELQRRLEDEPQTFTNKQLTESATAFLDRGLPTVPGGGLGGKPAGGPVTVNINLVKPQQESARPQGPVLDLEVEPN